LTVKTAGSITVSAVTNAGSTGQVVEYAVSTASSPTPAAGWQTTLSFSGLSASTTYYVFARTKEETNYFAGTASVSTGITTDAAATSSITMVQIPPSGSPPFTFTMGSSDSLDSGANPPHSVTLTSGFYMSETLITQEQYTAVMGSNPNNFSGTNLPVVNKLLYHIIVFCNKLSVIDGYTPAYEIEKAPRGSGIWSTDPDDWGRVPNGADLRWDAIRIATGTTGYRLPTEAQWEYACRAGTTTAYRTGVSITTSQANTSEAGFGWITPVKTYSENAWGLYDMHGNVFEHCWDRYADYTAGAATDPQGAVTGYARVFRGGSWFGPAQYARSAYRKPYDPAIPSLDIGFRVVRP
jgi:formylglycine-generating enzyme required for sulfatase activity